MWSSSPVCSLCVCPVCLQTGIHLPLIPKQLLACPPIGRIRNRGRSLLTWWLCSKERHGSPCVPSLSKWSHDPRHWPSLYPPVVVAFEAKWGVNKSNIHCIVWHPKGPGEVTLEVQITSGHGLLAFSCSISQRVAVPHTGNATQPPTATIIQVYLHFQVRDWLNGPLFGSVPPRACLVFKLETTVQRGERSIQSASYITMSSNSTDSEDFCP